MKASVTNVGFVEGHHQKILHLSIIHSYAQMQIWTEESIVNTVN